VPGPYISMYVKAVLRWAVASAPATEPIARDYSTWVSNLRYFISAAARYKHAYDKAGCRARVLHRSMRRLAQCMHRARWAYLRVGQIWDTTRVPPLKGNVILIF